MMRSTSSEVPTGTVDLVTITVNFDSDVAISRAAAKHIGQIGVPVATARRGSHGDENHIGIADRRFHLVRRMPDGPA